MTNTHMGPTQIPTDAELNTAADECLTDRQHQVWDLHTRGLSQQRIADHLRITRGAVRDHLKAIARRLDRHLRGDTR